jgi:drug/metabolite transporter (DMT)-like permease
MTDVAPSTARRGTLVPSLILVAVTLCWGMSFSLMKDWHDNAAGCPGGTVVAALSMILLRMIGALVVLAIVRPGMFWRPSWRAHRAGMWVGVAFFLGFALQASGLAWTTPSRSGFITSLSSAFVPFGMWLCFRTRVAAPTLVGLSLGVLGTALLSFGANGDPTSSSAAWLNRGDIMTLVAAVFFMAQVILLDRLGKGVESSHLTVSFFATCAVGAAAGIVLILKFDFAQMISWTHWTFAILQKPYMPVKLGSLIVFSTVLAFGLMNAYQPRVPASQAALIYLLESLFSSMIAVATGFDRLTWALAVGGGLILFGNLLVELPNWWREQRRLNPKDEVVVH